MSLSAHLVITLTGITVLVSPARIVLPRVRQRLPDRRRSRKMVKRLQRFQAVGVPALLPATYCFYVYGCPVGTTLA